jgi:peptidoglycan-associated lipoprotein
MRFTVLSYRRLVLALLGLGLLVLAGCGSKPKYPSCGGDKDCHEGEHCINKQCLQCGDDSHCKEGEKCVEGACVAQEKPAEAEDPDKRKKCKVDEDCADDEDCIDGRCSQPWKAEKPAALTCELKSVYFGFDQSTIPDEAREGLGKDADCIKEAGDKGLYLIGHTDPRGTEEYNIALSERRAQNVADYLAALGIDPARFRVVPKGETEATGTDESTYQQDRRVDLEWR